MFNLTSHFILTRVSICKEDAQKYGHRKQNHKDKKHSHETESYQQEAKYIYEEGLEFSFHLKIFFDLGFFEWLSADDSTIFDNIRAIVHHCFWGFINRVI